jgi:hypothetical protein
MENKLVVFTHTHSVSKQLYMMTEDGHYFEGHISDSTEQEAASMGGSTFVRSSPEEVGLVAVSWLLDHTKNGEFLLNIVTYSFSEGELWTGYLENHGYLHGIALTSIITEMTQLGFIQSSIRGLNLFINHPMDENDMKGVGKLHLLEECYQKLQNNKEEYRKLRRT